VDSEDSSSTSKVGNEDNSSGLIVPMEDERVPPVPIQNVANNNIIDVHDVVEREPIHVTHEDRLLI